MKKHLLRSLLLSLGVWCSLPLAAGEATSVPAGSVTAADSERLEWWREARFGLFIHWGPVSLKGTEIGWSRGGERRGYGSTGTEIPVEVYDNLYKQFNPTNFDARQWVAIAKAAGMKYLVFTSRHHDGFSMFDTRAGEHKITAPDSPYRRDVVKQLADACHRAGLRFGLYYSPPDWHHPDAFTDRHANYQTYLKTQVGELMTRYGKIDVLWYDGLGKTAQDYDAVAMNRMVRQFQPRILINNRSGLPEDFDTPEQEVGKFRNDRPWESCITICDQWAWKPDDRMKTLAQCLQTLIRCAGGDGNLLFNVGPMPDGRIEPRQVERLKEMGAWLKQYGRSVYATRGGPFKPGAWGASTHEGKYIYLHVFKWPGAELVLPPIGTKIVSSKVLTGGRVVVRQTDAGVAVEVPEKDRREIDTIIRLRLAGPAGDIAPVAMASAVRASASNVYQNDDEYGADKAFDDDANTRWATAGGTRQAWVAMDFGKPVPFDGVVIREAYEGRVKRFEFQGKQNGEWKTIFTGESIGKEFSRQFPLITAREVRLNILDATEGPTIYEIQVARKE